MCKTKVKYECDSTGKATKEYLDARNKEIYENAISRISGGKYKTFEDEKDFYLEFGKPLKTYTRTTAIRKHCVECSGQTSDKIDCPMKWGKYYDEHYPEGCSLNPWIRGVRYIPAGSKKVTQKQAIMLRCKLCQGSGSSLRAVRDCPAFLHVDENGIEHGCYLHAYRFGSNPWYGTNMTEEEKEELRTRLSKYRKEK